MIKQKIDIFKRITRLLFAVITLSVIVANLIINVNAKGKVFTDSHKIPKNKVGVLLGTSKTLEDDSNNPYFDYRVDAAVSLFKLNKIDIILISSSYESKHDDNPLDFKKALLKKGIPENKIFLDYNGLRTYNSILSLKEVYQLKKVTFISQEFHNERAIYIAEYFNIEAFGYSAKDVNGKLGFKMQLREYLARFKVFIDFIIDEKPMLKPQEKLPI